MEPQRLNRARRRQAWLYVGLLVFGARLAWAFVDIQLVSHDAFLEDAQRQQKRRVEIAPTRGAIEDRNGVPLAVNREQYGIYLVPRHIADVDRFADRFTEIVPFDEAELRGRIVGIVAGGHPRRDHDVAQHPNAVLIDVVLAVERERQHVGGAGLVHVALVQLGDLVVVDERQRQLDVDEALRLEGGAREVGEGGGIERHRRRVGHAVRDEDPRIPAAVVVVVRRPRPHRCTCGLFRPNRS